MAAPWTTVWFYNSESGSVISEPAFGDTIQSHLPGWHGPFGTKQEALNYYTQHKSANPSWKAPGGISVGKVASTAAGQAGSGLLSIGQFLANLANPHLWERVGEVVFGLILIAVGLAKMTNAVPIATKVAKAIA